MSSELSLCPRGLGGTPADGTGGHTVHLTKSMAHFHWHADTYMLAIAASNLLMYRHSYRFPQPGSVDTGVSVPIILDEFAVMDVKKNNGAEAV